MHSRLKRLFVSASVVSTLCAGLSAAADPLTGVYRGEVYSQPNTVNAYSTWLGFDVKMGQGHQAKDSWGNIENPGWQLGSWRTWVKAKAGRRFNYSVAMFPSGQGTLASCAAGAYDQRFKNLASNLVAYELQGTIIRLGWEFSGSWMPWYSGNGQQANFAACFRRIVTAMRTQQPNAGFEFDWNPNYDISAADLSATYPGDAYVDYIGLDMYDQGWNGAYPIPAGCAGSCALTRWQSVWNAQFGPALAKFKTFARSHNKRLSVPEWGVNDAATHGGGDDTYYVQQMLAFIFDPANNVGYHSYFDIQAADGHHQLSSADNTGGNTFVTEFPNAAAAFKNFYAGQNPQLSTTKASVSPATVTRGQSFNVTGTVTSPTARTLVLKYEIRNAANSALVTSAQYVNQAFTAGQTRSYTSAFTLPTSLSAGTYRVDTLVYTADWSQTLLYRNDTTFTAN
ncbi:glycoside hydrolase family 26 protein [Corallococcus aberystwythensis]|uniref:Beta-mannanase n=1 Tax=Corallococcus aberystwythensis TaxID=2316722 RepID=A0A3A8QQY4_9BACT|nr:glycosyl hydrolase [Corallococcus aberystwythensis]RKH71123.1 beta-mannanase [Corallococcus aberystwythensis]